MLKLTVSSLIRYLKNKLDTDEKLQRIYVNGEISNFHRHFSGHIYFTLKDEYAQINCVMFKSAASSLKFEPKTGDKVVVYANTSIFEQSGQLQLYVLKIEPDGLGDLYAQYEQLKKKLSDEGKFSDDHKIELESEYPDRVAVLVGDKSAAMSDIKTAFLRRWPLCSVDYYPVLVQGGTAAADIIKELIKVDKLDYDAIILSRGGGSFEDLFCFNDENLVNTIYNLKTFIITGIGHEQDFTLADFVADLRAPTPTAAVELITPDIEDVIEEVNDYEERLYSSLIAQLDSKRLKYDYLLERLTHYQASLLNLSARIDSNVNTIRQEIIHRINSFNDDIIHLLSTIRLKADFKLNESNYTYKRLNTLLEAYSAENVLKRGYTLVMQDNKVVKSSKKLKDKEFEVRFNDGSITAIKR